MSKQKRTWDVILVVVMVLLCLLWIYPIVLILLNSLKTEGSFTTSTVFRLPTAETFAGLRNYVYGVTKMDFLWLVPDPRKQQAEQVHEPADRVLHGRSLPDGHVHPVQNC